MVIKVLCVNDSAELAFPIGTSEQIIEKQAHKFKDKLTKHYPGNSIYVRIREVPVYEEPEGGK